MLRSCTRRPGPPPTAPSARDLAFALEPGGADAGAAGWGAVAAAPPAARLRDARPVASCAPCALGPWHLARGAARAGGEGWRSDACSISGARVPGETRLVLLRAGPRRQSPPPPRGPPLRLLPRGQGKEAVPSDPVF